MRVQQSTASAIGQIDGGAVEAPSVDRASLSDVRMRDAFRRVDLQALRVSNILRIFSLATIGVWLAVLMGAQAALFYWALLLAFMIIGFMQHRAARREAPGLLAALILLDSLLLGFALVADNPLSDGALLPGQRVQYSRELYYFVLLAGVAACYQPRRVLWAGFCCMLSWTLAFLWVSSDPAAVTSFDQPAIVDQAVWAALLANPNFVDFNKLHQALVVMAIVTFILAAVVKRARNTVRAQITTARARANLARYFAPAIVDELAAKDDAFDSITEQSAAVLFADVVGFTKMAEDQPPEQVIGFLRALHYRLEQAIFDNGGTLDKYMGDGVMAIFGAPQIGPDDACRAIAAALAIQGAADKWNDVRAAAGFPPVRLSVGVHYGRVVSGDIGSERRLEFATIGDAVNLASRLESATRGEDALVMISAETAARAAAEDPRRAETLLRGFSAAPQLQIIGHSPVDALALKIQA